MTDEKTDDDGLADDEQSGDEESNDDRTDVYGVTGRAAGVLRRFAPYLMVLVGGLSVWVVYSRGFYAFLGPVVGAFAGSLLAVALGRGTFDPPNRPIDWRIGLVVTNAYVVVLLALYRTALYTRPIAHYLVLGGAAGFIAYQIWSGQPKRHVLPQILVVAFLTYWSTQFVYPSGVITPDSGFVGTAGDIARTGFVPEGVLYRLTPGHMIYVAEGMLATGLSERLAYQLLSILGLLVTVVLVAVLDRVVPGIDRRMALFGALIFALMSFTLRRGMFPFKTNFFRPFLLFVVIVFFHFVYRSDGYLRYIIPTGLCMLALLTGHMYSAGAALILLVPLWCYEQLTRLFRHLDYPDPPTKSMTTPVLAIVVVGLVGFSLFADLSFLSRVTNVLTSLTDVVVPSGGTSVDGGTVGTPVDSGSGGTSDGGGGGGTSGGRYSSLSLSVLLFSTAGQAILFTMGVAGIGLALRRREWSLDAIVAWMAGGLMLIGLSVFVNANDIPPQRIYLLLGFFGLNLMAAIAVFAVAERFPVDYRGVVVGAVVFVFVAFALASPVGSVALSPVGDEVPHKWRYDTNHGLAQQSWADEHVKGKLLETASSTTEMPLERTSSNQASILLENITAGMSYEVPRQARTDGVRFGRGGSRLGSNAYVFVTLPDDIGRDSKIYTNGHDDVYLRENRTQSPR